MRQARGIEEDRAYLKSVERIEEESYDLCTVCLELHYSVSSNRAEQLNIVITRSDQVSNPQSSTNSSSPRILPDQPYSSLILPPNLL